MKKNKSMNSSLRAQRNNPWIAAPRCALLAMTVLSLYAPPAFAQDTAAPQPSISMHGDVKYKSDFTHLDYVNPDAPKGGTLKQRYQHV